MLRSAGFEAIAACRLEQLQTIDAPIQLLVLCHTLSTDECEQALRIATSRWPEAKKLVLAPLSGIRGPVGDPVNNFSVAQGPARLIDRIHQLLPVSPALAVRANSKTLPFHLID